MVQLTPQTVNRLCEYFLYLATLESEIEIIRNMLCEFDRFHPFPLFKYIDGIISDSKGKLTPADVLQFMEDNGFVHNLQECIEFIDLYDDESKGVLLYSQYFIQTIRFLRTCLPQNNINLRQKIVLADIEKLPLEENIAYTLAKMINHEIKSMQTTAALIQQLEDCSDYSPTACFQFLDTKSTEKLQSANFKELFTKSAIVIYPQEVQALFRRFDLLSDGVVDKIEFLKHFKKRVFNTRQCKTPIKEKPYLQNFQQKSTTKTPKRKCQTASTPAKKLNSILKNSGSSPKKELDNPRSVSFISSTKSKMNSKLNSSSIFKTPSSQDKKYIEQKTELRAQLQLFKVQRSKQNVSTVKKPPVSKQPETKTNYFKPHEFICNTLINIMNLEKAIDKQKIELCLFNQFSICDVFRELDQKQCGFLTVQELEKYSKRQNLQQIFKRLAPDGRLRFNQFINLIEPLSTFYQEELHKVKYPTQFIFTHQQKKIFQTLLELISKREAFLDEINMKINCGKQYDLKYLFMLLDESSNDNMISLKDVYIQLNQLDAFLFKQQKQPELEDIELLFTWLDTDKDGKISFPDFINIFAF